VSAAACMMTSTLPLLLLIPVSASLHLTKLQGMTTVNIYIDSTLLLLQ
jgi:hypothetical protein